MKRQLPLLGMALALGGCAASKTWKCSVASENTGYVNAIGCAADYTALGEDKKKTGDTRSINFVIDRHNQNRVYFLNTNSWELHIDFAFLVLSGHQPDEKQWDEFVKENYVSPSRRFYLGKLVQFLKTNQLIFQTWEGDQASPAMIAEAFEAVRKRLFNGVDLQFRPTSPVQQRRLTEIARRIPVANDRKLFAGMEYQPLNPAMGVGRLRFVKASQLEASPPLPTDIVVLDHTPPDVPVVQGIITNDFQTPLSHINLLCRQRGTPNMALFGALDSPTLRALEGKLVRLAVRDLNWKVEPVSESEARKWWDQHRPKGEIKPRYASSQVGIINLDSADESDIARIGAKAANLAGLMKIGAAVRTPRPAFALPFAVFDEHMRRYGLWAELDSIVRDAPMGEELEARLFRLRWRVFTSPLNPALLDELHTVVRSRFGSAPVRFRSSTNVEDLAEFNGAGLYTSVGASLEAGSEALERAVKVVWASTYNYAAFVERDYYRVRERDVRMGVLIHAAFKKERVNGVALAYAAPGEHSYALLQPSMYINAQAGDLSVTNPTGEASPEELLWYRGNEAVRGWLEVAQFSSVSPEKRLMTEPQYGELVRALDAIHRRSCSGGRRKCTIDVEWKLAADNLVYIKQSRPLGK